MLLLQDHELLAYCRDNGEPIPFSLSSIRKDRLDFRLGGLPHRRIGGKTLYNPTEVQAFLAGQPIVQSQVKAASGRTGRPTKAEQVEAERRGLSVRELRSQLKIGGG